MAPELGAVLAGGRRGALHFHTFPTTTLRARQEAPKVRRTAMFTGVSAFRFPLGKTDGKTGGGIAFHAQSRATRTEQLAWRTTRDALVLSR